MAVLIFAESFCQLKVYICCLEFWNIEKTICNLLEKPFPFQIVIQDFGVLILVNVEGVLKYKKHIGIVV